MEATIRGCRLFYRYTQKADAPTVLFLHGWGCDGSMFSFIENGLRADASVLTPDFPGHGQSGEPPEPWDVPAFAEQIIELLDQLEIERVSIVGHSFGGRVAIYMASHQPERVEKLVLTGAAGIRKPLSATQQKRQSQFKRYNAALNALKGVKALAPTVEKWQTALRERFGSADYVKLDEVMRQTFSKVVNQDLLPMLHDIAAPTLLIWGSEDTETPLWMGQQMEQSIPDAGLVIFEGRSHFAFIEEWQRFLLIVKEFLKEGEAQ